MKDVVKIALALSILLSGIALVPVVGLPAQGFSWQRYAGAYTPATLSINYDTGRPSSYFTISGANFTPNSNLDVSANGVVLGSVEAGDAGDVVFLLNTINADVGFYLIEVSGDKIAVVHLTLDSAAPLRPQEGSGEVFSLPSGIAAHRVLLPVILQQ